VTCPTVPTIQAFFEAAVVFCDASGFTALTEALAKQPHGVPWSGAKEFWPAKRCQEKVNQRQSTKDHVEMESLVG